MNMIRHRKEQELRRLMTQKAVLSAKDGSSVSHVAPALLCRDGIGGCFIIGGAAVNRSSSGSTESER